MREIVNLLVELPNNPKELKEKALKKQDEERIESERKREIELQLQHKVFKEDNVGEINSWHFATLVAREI